MLNNGDAEKLAGLKQRAFQVARAIAGAELGVLQVDTLEESHRKLKQIKEEIELLNKISRRTAEILAE